MSLSLCFLALVLLSFGAASVPCCAGELFPAEELERGILEANENAKVCNLQPDCLGKAATVILTRDIKLTKFLPSLWYNAHLIVTGNCSGAWANGQPRSKKRCIIDGQLNFTMFTFAEFGPPQARLELSSLIIQRAQQGVMRGVWAATTSTDVVFRNNIGDVISQGGMGGVPLQTFTNCRFLNNQGTSIRLGSIKYGLGRDGTALVVRRTQFRGNRGSAEFQGGGAVLLAGQGLSTFENVLFADNLSENPGGAVFLDETQAQFRGVTFANNTALGAVGGGAVAGTSGFFGSVNATFCTCTFRGNSAPARPEAASLSFAAELGGSGEVQEAVVSFCNTEIPPGSVFPPPPGGVVNQGTGGKCFADYCAAL